MTEITQADREAAAVFYGTWGGTKGWQHLEEPIREGLVDDNALVRAFACHRMKANETQAREIERLRGALEHIGIYGCGMLNQPAALNAPEEVWLKQRIFEMERTARAALGDSHD